MMTSELAFGRFSSLLDQVRPSAFARKAAEEFTTIMAQGRQMNIVAFFGVDYLFTRV
jgi:hypothetical protein